MIPYFTLNDGSKMPSVGMGCWMGVFGGEERVVEMCKKALNNGYRHFDTASGYGNEKQVGLAIRGSGIPRSEIFLTTKLANAAHGRVREAFEESLTELNCEYIDLYLLHWPQAARNAVPGGNGATARLGVFEPDESPTFVETWKEMEKLLETGKVKSIGVSNFSIKTLSTLLEHCKVVPVVNQVELHPCLPQHTLKKFCAEKGILLTAYSPVGRMNPILMSHPAIAAIAEKAGEGVTPTQVVLSWAVQRGTSIVPKSEDEERMRKNIDLVKLALDDMTALDEFHKLGSDMHRSLGYHADDGTACGWKYEWLGWPMAKGGFVIGEEVVPS